ncbi:GxxExxY protein [Opitutus sp. GAS368]|jgi:GxxExxY protein|uniref:GxxExxY protein n=1 Tax=Opitutus sp. GAS368 TaxID=1882749 RepID=UPI00087D7FFF|nr:GxxExxY protein [Opitutus sp. GAS368]SDS58310.1 GxxExxY protein [Opitutus sp. GAS368]
MTTVTGLYQQEGYDFMAAVFDVYNEMGHGFLEEVYHESLELELVHRAIPHVSKPKLSLFYKGQLLKKQYEADFIVIGEIVVELKAVKALLSEHEAQLINYLRATGKRVGYLVNFGSFPKLEWKRFVL